MYTVCIFELNSEEKIDEISEEIIEGNSKIIPHIHKNTICLKSRKLLKNKIPMEVSNTIFLTYISIRYSGRSS